MSLTLTAAQICERILQQIGAYSTADRAADPVEMDRVLGLLDLIVAEVAGTEACYWLRPSTIPAALTADTASYNFASLLGSNKPTDGILWVVNAYLTDGNGNDEPLTIITRDEYEELTRKASGGAPECIFIDRLAREANQKLYVYPVPAVSTYSLKLVVQTHAPNLTASKGAVSHDFWPSWQRYLIQRGAYDAGGGPVRRMPIQEREQIKRDYMTAFNALQAKANREHARPRRVQAWG